MDRTTSAHTAIVIVSYNTHDLLRQCLQSAIDTAPSAHVVVVDNASHDGSADMVRREFPRVTLIANDSNRGFAAATNQGIRASETGNTILGVNIPKSKIQNRVPGTGESKIPDYILLLNPDAALCSGALDAMIAFLDRHPRVGCVGARLVYPDGRPQEGAFRFPTLIMTLFDLFPPRGPLLGRLPSSPLNGRYREERGDQPFPIDHPLGAAMLIRRETLDEVGLLDESYWLYAEEVDWCYRCKQAGWSIWQVPQARVVHAGGASSQQFKGRSFVALHRSRLQFFAKHYSLGFNRWNRRIVRAGMVWAVLHTWRAWQGQRIDRDELQRRLLAYGRVLQLTVE